mgnify:CR=1 FL=1|jgi:hypothetical protein|tara:strand:- start:540 stop:1058 length:519 start_codon:yes stop_codon:yes gene_type:complete
MKPRFEDASPEVYEMLNKAIELEEKLETLEKAKMCSCGSGKSQAVCCPDMKKERTHKLGSFTPGAGGVNEGSCADDCWCKSPPGGAPIPPGGAPMLEKANYATTFSTEPGGVEFHSETGGQTRNAHYTTNQHLLDSTDVTNKGATNESVSLDSLSPKMNTHDRASEGRVDEG